MSLEIAVAQRLRVLEAKLGGIPPSSSSPNQVDTSETNDKYKSNNDLKSANIAKAKAGFEKSSLLQRLNTLEQKYNNLLTSTTPNSQTLSSLLSNDPIVIQDLLNKDLPAGAAALTHQQQIVAPIAYRQQEILAYSDQFRQDLQLVAEIQHYLQIGQDAPNNNNTQTTRNNTATTVKTTKSVTEDFVTQAPILVQVVPMTDSSASSLDQLVNDAQVLQKRVLHLSQRFDKVLHQYHTLTTIMLEKMVMANEQLTMLELETQQQQQQQ